MSDQGSHFKDKVIKKFNQILQINYHMTTPYLLWANGTVEKVNNEIQQHLRSPLSEWQMESSQWPLLLPVIQSALNHLSSPSRANNVPLKITTGLDALSPLSVVFDPDANKIRDCPMSEEKLKEYMRDLGECLDEIHTKVETSSKSSRATKRKNMNKMRSAVQIWQRRLRPVCCRRNSKSFQTWGQMEWPFSNHRGFLRLGVCRVFSLCMLVAFIFTVTKTSIKPPHTEKRFNTTSESFSWILQGFSKRREIIPSPD